MKNQASNAETSARAGAEPHQQAQSSSGRSAGHASHDQLRKRLEDAQAQIRELTESEQRAKTHVTTLEANRQQLAQQLEIANVNNHLLMQRLVQVSNAYEVKDVASARQRLELLQREEALKAEYIAIIQDMQAKLAAANAAAEPASAPTAATAGTAATLGRQPGTSKSAAGTPTLQAPSASGGAASSPVVAGDASASAAATAAAGVVGAGAVPDFPGRSTADTAAARLLLTPGVPTPRPASFEAELQKAVAAVRQEEAERRQQQQQHAREYVARMAAEMQALQQRCDDLENKLEVERLVTAKLRRQVSAAAAALHEQRQQQQQQRAGRAHRASPSFGADAAAAVEAPPAHMAAPTAAAGVAAGLEPTTPLGPLPFESAEDAAAAAILSSLANLSPGGRGAGGGYDVRESEERAGRAGATPATVGAADVKAMTQELAQQQARQHQQQAVAAVALQCGQQAAGDGAREQQARGAGRGQSEGQGQQQGTAAAAAHGAAGAAATEQSAGGNIVSKPAADADSSLDEPPQQLALAAEPQGERHLDGQARVRGARGDKMGGVQGSDRTESEGEECSEGQGGAGGQQQQGHERGGGHAGPEDSKTESEGQEEQEEEEQEEEEDDEEEDEEEEDLGAKAATARKLLATARLVAARHLGHAAGGAEGGGASNSPRRDAMAKATTAVLKIAIEKVFSSRTSVTNRAVPPSRQGAAAAQAAALVGVLAGTAPAGGGGGRAGVPPLAMGLAAGSGRVLGKARGLVPTDAAAMQQLLPPPKTARSADHSAPGPLLAAAGGAAAGARGTAAMPLDGLSGDDVGAPGAGGDGGGGMDRDVKVVVRDLGRGAVAAIPQQQQRVVTHMVGNPNTLPPKRIVTMPAHSGGTSMITQVITRPSGTSADAARKMVVRGGSSLSSQSFRALVGKSGDAGGQMFRLSSEELTPRDHGMSGGGTTATTTHIPPLSLGLSHSQAMANANLAAALGRSGSGTAAGGYKDAAGRAGAGAGAGALMDLHGSSAAGMGVGRSPDAESVQQHLRQHRGAGRSLGGMEGLDALASAAAAAEQDEGMTTAAAAAKDAAAAAAVATGAAEAAKVAPGQPAAAAAAGQGSAGGGAGLQPLMALASGFAVPSAGGVTPADPRLRVRAAATAATVNPTGPGLAGAGASTLQEGARKVLGAEAAGPGGSGAAAAPSGGGAPLGQGGRVVVVVRGAALTPASGSESDASTPSHSRDGSPERRRSSPGGHDDTAPDEAHGSTQLQRWGPNQHEQLLDRQGSSPGNNAARSCAGAGGNSPDARRQPAAQEAAGAAGTGEGGDGGVGGVKRSREEAGLDAGVGAVQCEARRKLSSQAQDVGERV